MTAAGRAALVATAACLLVVPGGAAADDTRAQLEQRVRLAARLLADSPAAARIVASGDSAAQGHLDEGRVHHAMAQDALARGDLPAARRAVDEALRHMGLARRRVPDAPQRQAAARQRHEQLLATLERLLDAWPVRPQADEPMDGDLFAALGLMATARGLAAEGRHDDAVHTLGAAERHLLAGMRHLTQLREVDYTLRASTPEQELQLELRRHQGLAELVPLALTELRPRPEAVALIERYSQTSRQLREQAVQAAAAGDTAAALQQVRQAALHLQRALQAAGVSMPAAQPEIPR